MYVLWSYLPRGSGSGRKASFHETDPFSLGQEIPLSFIYNFLVTCNQYPKTKPSSEWKIKGFVFKRRLSTRREESLRTLSKSEIN